MKRPMRCRVVAISVATLLACGAAMGESVEPKNVLTHDGSDPAADALAYAMMETLSAEPAKCPAAFEKTLYLSIVFCGRVPPGTKVGEREKGMIDAALIERGGSTPRAAWRKEARTLQRSYTFGKIPISVELYPKSGLVALTYPKQLKACLEVGLPRAGEDSQTTLPVLIETTAVRPVYPEIAHKARMEGAVLLQALIRHDGTVGELCVQYSSNRLFEQAAIDAVRQWHYEPALRAGQPVDVSFTVFVKFILF